MVRSDEVGGESAGSGQVIQTADSHSSPSAWDIIVVRESTTMTRQSAWWAMCAS